MGDHLLKAVPALTEEARVLAPVANHPFDEGVAALPRRRDVPVIGRRNIGEGGRRDCGGAAPARNRRRSMSSLIRRQGEPKRRRRSRPRKRRRPPFVEGGGRSRFLNTIAPKSPFQVSSLLVRRRRRGDLEGRSSERERRRQRRRSILRGPLFSQRAPYTKAPVVGSHRRRRCSPAPLVGAGRGGGSRRPLRCAFAGPIAGKAWPDPPPWPSPARGEGMRPRAQLRSRHFHAQRVGLAGGQLRMSSRTSEGGC